MLNRSIVLPLLIASAALAFAQDPQPSADSTSPSSGTTSPTKSDSSGSSTGGNPGSQSGINGGLGNGVDGSSPQPGATGTSNGGVTEPGVRRSGGFLIPVLTGTSRRPGGTTFDPAFDQGFNQGVLSTGTAAGTIPLNAAKPSAENVPQGPTFVIPGGYGSAPKTVTVGEGEYARPPISFSATVEEGYTDNVYNSSGKKYPDTVIPASQLLERNDGFAYEMVIPSRTIPGSPVNPVQGSWISEAMGGTQILLSASRLVLSANLNGGASYYWNRNSDPFSPTGGASLLFAYRASPRMQFSASFGGSYQTQPNLNAVSGVTQGGAGDYISTSFKCDLGYQWTGRISTVSTVNLGSQSFLQSSSQQGNYIEPTYGESLRYTLSPRTIVVAEYRYGQANYSTSTNSSETQYILGGCDLSFSSRCAGTFRGGLTLRKFEEAGTSPLSSPFGELNLDYGFGRAMGLSLSSRYGFEEGGGVTLLGTQKTFRTNLTLHEAFSTKFTAGISVGFSNSVPVTVQMGTSTAVTSSQPTQNTVTAGLNGSYQLTRTISFFGSYSYSQVLSTTSLSYNANMIFLGMTYQF